MTATTLNLPFSLGDRVFIIQEVRVKNPKRSEFHIREGIVESIHIGRKLKYGSYVTDSYVKVRSTLVYSLFPPIPLAHAQNYIFENYSEALKQKELLEKEGFNYEQNI